MSKYCHIAGCNRRPTSDARTFGQKLCSKHFDKWIEQQDWTEQHECRAPANMTLGDAIVGYTYCECGERVDLDDESRRMISDERSK